MFDANLLQDELSKRLKPLHPYTVILFGSHANGTANQESDIDLYIVTNDEFTPQHWQEKSELTRKFSKKLRDLRTTVSIDLIVHTKTMHEHFLATGSSFCKEIMSKGIVLL